MAISEGMKKGFLSQPTKITERIIDAEGLGLIDNKNKHNPHQQGQHVMTKTNL